MMVRLSAEEDSLARGHHGATAGMAMRIITEMAELMGANRLVQISSAHIDSCLYHGDGGVEFAERLVAGGGKVRVPTSLNVGALDLLHPKLVRADSHRREMARRLMDAYVKLGCRPTWTCAPYQAGHRPSLGDQVAWGESNAVAFANSVLGARTNRYGDFFDICCALVSRAPYTGLHVTENRRASILVDTSNLPLRLRQSDVLYPVLGSWLGATVGDQIAVIDGLPPDTTEDQLKALGAAASSTGAVGMFHVAGVTPEAPDVETALGGVPPTQVFRLTASVLRDALDRLYRQPGKLFSDEESNRLREEADRMTRYLEDIDLARERIVVMQEEFLAQQAQQQNSRMYVLSVVAAVFLPLTFVTGLLGMNVGGLPGLESPNGFVASVIIMVVAAAGLLAFFRWKRWL